MAVPQVSPFGERRLHDRKSCGVSIDIDDNFRIYTAQLRNLSLGGAAIEHPATFKPKLGKQLTLTIPYRQKNGYVTVRGKITRIQNGEVAVAFD